MPLHRLLSRQLKRLGLRAETPPDAGSWQELLERVSVSYAQSDENRQLSERSMELSSREMQRLHERERQIAELLEERVQKRTVDLALAELSARISEYRFQLTFDSAPIGIMDTSVEDGTILRANQKLSELFGYRPDKLIGMHTDKLLLLDTVDDERPNYRQQMLNGEINIHSSERRYMREDGSALWVNRTISLVRDTEGQPLYFVHIIEDITERKLLARRREMEHAVTQTLAESATVEEAVSIVLRTICQTQGWACGAHWKWIEAEELLRCADTWHSKDDGVEDFIDASREQPNEAPAWRGAPPGTDTGGLVRRVWTNGASVWFSDITQQPDFRRGPAAVKAGIRSAFGFPIMTGTRPLGVLEFYSRAVEPPDDALLQVVRAIGSQLGQFIQRRQAEDKVMQLAQFDSITGLPNRNLLTDRLSQMLALSQRNDKSVGVLFVDLDYFKIVNDTHGHAAGDQLLRLTAERMSACVRSGDTVGRLSGDEFAVVLANLAKTDDAGLVAGKIVRELAKPFDLQSQLVYISASIGIALYPGDSTDPVTLLKLADTAMYRAKERGRNEYQFYLPQMNERLVLRQQLESSLRGALDRKEFLLHYQPKVSLASGAIIGFEALLRWQHGEQLISPAVFISILEETGLIVPVGEWVLNSVCEQIKQWERAGIKLHPIAVNLSARQFQSKNLANLVEQLLRENGIRADLLQLELTESLLMSDAQEAIETLRHLKMLGVQLSVDDFGTGYSSLAYLRRFPLDELKIDREFIKNVTSDPGDATIALTIISLAHSLKLRVVAEGVETEGQLNFLMRHGCDEMQGYYFSRPEPAATCARMLTEDRRLLHSESVIGKNIVTILLVVDDKTELLRLDHALAEEGFHILTATSADDGFEILSRNRIDIVISDNDIQGISGIELLARVRKLYPDTLRVLVSSGDDTPTLSRATNKAGIHLFLPGSYPPLRMRAEIREVLRGKHKSAATVNY